MILKRFAPSCHSLLALVAIAAATVLGSCKLPGEVQDFSKLEEEFVYSSLALSPATATAAGYHEHNGRVLDDFIDDYSPAGIRDQRRFYNSFQERLNSIGPESLQPEDQADYRILQDQIALQRLDLDRIRSYRHNPTAYVELAGNALYAPYILNYASKPERFGHIIKRLQRIPMLMDQARANLIDSPDIWTKVAQEENDGNIGLIDKTLRNEVPANLASDFNHAAEPAIAALRRFNEYLKNDLSKRTASWRLGTELYAEKFKYTLDVGKTPEQVLAEAEAALRATREEMARLAAPKTVKQAMDEIAQQHANPQTYFEEAKRDLQAATDFVRAKHLLTLPTQANLQVIPTPEFMRGIYAVGGFNAAPALEPQLGAFYWITPIPPEWPKERVESKLREYNTYGLQELTVHEAMPGHYVQFEFANNVQPKSRRIVRALFGNGPYVEGWAFYTQVMMSDEGYLNNSVPLRLTMLKQTLRAISNAILDIRLQTMDMTDQQALDLMINDTFQEKEEATAKLQRAQLSSVQLPMYFTGLHGWLQVRDEYKQRKGSAFNLQEFHDAALKESSVPLPVLTGLIANK